MRVRSAVLSFAFFAMILSTAPRPATPADEGTDKETMRKHLLKMGVPPDQVDQILQQLCDKLKQSGLDQETADSMMLQRQREVIIDVRWRVESHPFWTDVTYPCERGTKRTTIDRFVCRYRAEGRATGNETFEYLPFSETERIVKGSDLGLDQIRIRRKLGLLRPRGDSAARVEGECKAQERPSYPCDVSRLAVDQLGDAPVADVGADLTRQDKALVLAFRGALTGKARGTPFNQDQPVDVVGLNVPFKEGVVQANYAEFFRSLMQTGHFRRTYRWTQQKGDAPEDTGAEVELDLDVALKDGPAPQELAPPPPSTKAASVPAPAQPGGGSPAPPH